MRKSVWIFLLAILAPSAVLGWLALRSAEEQKIILERRTAELYQRQTEGVASAARAVVDEQRRSFAEAVRLLLADSAPDAVAQEFAVKIGEVWEQKAVGFAIGRDGRLASPSTRGAQSRPEWQRFLRDNRSFLGDNSSATVYNVPVDTLYQPDLLRNRGNALRSQELQSASKAAASKTSQSAKSKLAEVKRQALPSKESTVEVGRGAGSVKDEEKDAKERRRMAPVTAAAPSAPAPKSKPMAQAPLARSQTAPSSRMAIEGGSKGLPNTKSLARAEPSAPVEDKSVQSREQAAPLADAASAPMPPPAPAPTQAAIPDAEPESAQADRAEDLQAVAKSDAYQTTQSAQLAGNQQLRNVLPQETQFDLNERAQWSAVVAETTEFRQLTEGANEGMLTRFVEDKLTLLYWLRPAQAPELIFGCVIDAADLASLWKDIIPEPPTRGKSAEYVLALLDDRARPVVASANGKSRDWKRPFVASEIGEALPHWEAALYLMRPEQLAESATGLRRTLAFLVVGMLGAIVLGGWLVVADVRRQMALAQQKTDFVSNVSHELKTPLTSIRMFAELMLGGRAETQAKSPQYLRIIMVEAERLTRLINNVLDFAKLERRQKRVDRHSLDLHEVISRTWESHEIHLRECGFATRWQAAPPPYRVEGDEDALAQILVNLLSNAEKYCGERREVELHSYIDGGDVCVAVLDRGPGIPSGEERKIFEPFYRAHDSLSSGIQGSGLGLTLARHLAQEMGGRIEYRRRKDGGSEFALRMPLAAECGTGPEPHLR